jgi:hypothetical protein
VNELFIVKDAMGGNSMTERLLCADFSVATIAWQHHQSFMAATAQKDINFAILLVLYRLPKNCSLTIADSNLLREQVLFM